MSKAAKHKKILIVDDESEMRIFLSSMLESGGYDSIQAGDGEEGLQKAFEESPDAIILDLMVTPEGLIQMYGELKEDEHLKRIPVIILSDIDEKIFNHYWKLQSYPSGGPKKPDAFLGKPPEREELVRVLGALTGADSDPANRAAPEP